MPENNVETPRTDEALDGWVPEFRGPSEKNFIEFTRTLERETISLGADLVTANAKVKTLNEQLCRQAREHARELREETRASVTEAYWQERNDRDNAPHGSY